MVGLSGAISAGVIGGVVGAIAGYYGGWLDNLLMRVTDLFLAIPFLVVLLIGSRFMDKFLPGSSLVHTILILSLFFWMPDARIGRGVFLSLKEKEFVEAARASGARDSRIIFWHMIPNAMGPITVNATLGVPAAILPESALSLLRFGAQPPTPTWGNLLNDARGFIKVSTALTLYPGRPILLPVLSVTYLGAA